MAEEDGVGRSRAAPVQLDTGVAELAVLERNKTSERIGPKSEKNLSIDTKGPIGVLRAITILDC